MALSNNLAPTDIRIELVGSLYRPPWLKEAFVQHRAGNVSEDELRETQDRAIREVIAKQEGAGLPVVNDGEYRRVSFMESATNSFHGLSFDGGSVPDQVRPGTRETTSTEQVDLTGRVTARRNVPLEEYRFAQQVATRPIKVTLLGPDRLVRRHRWQGVYASEEEYVQDLVAGYRQIVGELVAAGCRYVQIDGPEYTAYVDPPSLERMKARGEDPERSLERAIAMDNAIMAGFTDVTFGLHICRGNRQGMYHREGAYDTIAERLFGSSNYDRFLLEYDTERAGGFEPLRFVPKGRTAVLGLVTTKSPEVERANDLKASIDQASHYLDPEKLALSPQCGFGSGLPLDDIFSEEVQWQKIEVIREVATQLWG